MRHVEDRLQVVPRETFLAYEDALHQGLYIHPNPIVRRVFWARLRALLRAAPSSASRVLDFGCGDGALLPSLARTYSYVVGLDLDMRAATKIVSHYSLPNVWLIEADGTSLPFRDREFDLVLTTEVLEHIRSLRLGLAEIERVLTYDGKLLVSVPTENVAYNLVRRVAGFVRPMDHYNNAAIVLAAVADVFVLDWYRYFPLNWRSIGGFALIGARKRAGRAS